MFGPSVLPELTEFFVLKASLSLPKRSGDFYGDYYIALSPNGNSLAVLRGKYEDNSELFIINLADNAEKKIHQFDFLVWSVNFNRDGNSLVYSDNRKEGKIVQLDIKSNSTKVLYTSSGIVFNQIYSSEEQNIIYNRLTAEANIWQVSLTTESFIATQMSHLNSSRFEWKPIAGKDTLAFVSGRGGSEHQLWIRRKQDIFPIASLDSALRLESYAWFSDDTNLIISTGAKQLYKVDTINDRTELIDLPYGASYPFVSSDSRWLYYSADING